MYWYVPRPLRPPLSPRQNMQAQPAASPAPRALSVSAFQLKSDTCSDLGATYSRCVQGAAGAAGLISCSPLYSDFLRSCSRLPQVCGPCV